MADVKTTRSILMPSLIDGQKAIDLRLSLVHMINEGTRKFLWDFLQTEYISLFGAQELATIARFLNKIGGQVVICQISPKNKEVLENLGIAHLFQFANLTESVLILVLKELTTCFEDYEDVLDIKARLEGTVVTIEIYLLFNENQTMGQVQQTMDAIRCTLEGNIKNCKVLIVASAKSHIEGDRIDG